MSGPRQTSNPRLQPVPGNDVELARINVVLQSINEKLDRLDEDMRALEKRTQGLEEKVAIVRGMWLAVGIASVMLGLAGTVVAIIVGIKRWSTGL